MKKILLAGAALVALCTSVPALAADYPVKAPLAPAFNWTGYYVGAEVGYGWGRVGIRAPDEYQDTKIRGGFVGGTLGINWQVNNNWVLGAGAYIDWSDIRGTSFNPDGDETYKAKLKNYGAILGRVGFLPMPQVMLYGTGGFALGSYTATLIVPIGGGEERFTDSHVHTGWAAGFGVEYVVNRNVTVYIGYLYFDFSKQNYHFEIIQPVAAKTNTFKIGINWYPSH